MTQPSPLPRTAGLTLPELLLALALTMLAGHLTIAGLDRLLAGHRLATSSNELVHRLHEARHAALSRGTEVVLCPSSDGLQCSDVAWHAGWILFVNADVENPPRVSADDTVLAVSAPTPGLHLSANRPAFVMRPFGRRSTNGTFRLCDPRQRVPERSVVVSYTGKPRTATTPATASCGPAA